MFCRATIYHFAGKINWMGSMFFVIGYIVIMYVSIVSIQTFQVSSKNLDVKYRLGRGYIGVFLFFMFSISALYLIYGPLLYSRLASMEIETPKIRSKLKRVFWFTFSIIVFTIAAGCLFCYDIAHTREIVFNPKLFFLITFGHNLTEFGMIIPNLIYYSILESDEKTKDDSAESSRNVQFD